MDKDSVSQHTDTVIVCSSFHYPSENPYVAFYEKDGKWWRPFYGINSGVMYAFTPFDSKVRIKSSFGNYKKVKIKNRISYSLQVDVAGVKFCNGYQIGDVIERVGSLFYMFLADTCANELYGGPLIWYEDSEFGRFDPRIDSVVVLPWEEPNDTTNSIHYRDKTDLNPIHIFPQPFQDRLRINSDFKLDKLELYNMQGKLIKSLSSDDIKSHLEINTQLWKSGMYFMKYQSGTIVGYQKLLKL